MMNTVLFKKSSSLLSGLICIMMGLSITFSVYAKQDCEGISVAQRQYDIGFNSKLNVVAYNSTKELAQWSLYNSENKLMGQGVGNATGELEFTTPGTYKVVFTVAATSDHEAHSDASTIVVHSVKMTFLFDEMKFSAFPKKGIDTKGTTLKIPVQVESFDGKTVKYNAPSFLSAGIATDIKGEIKAEFVELNPGKTILTYQLSGSAKLGGYIMFDFTDINGQIQSTTLNQEIK